ncbi:LuxR C-terminal-related transcriptional regulator [Streptomyces scopuliridis]|uniref:helix-turn-helix transcriptional regulator n=1 Tax=Streptomyces scopuliridis TaxID=452529 RepID=UPI0036AA4BDF
MGETWTWTRAWTDPAFVLDVVVRPMSAPRAGTLSRFSHELAVLLPHRVAAIRTGDCPRSPVKAIGDQAITNAVTSAELEHLAERAVPGEAVLLDAVLGGEERRLVLLSSRPAVGNGAVIALVPDDARPTEDVLALAVRLWHLTSIDAGQRAVEPHPDVIAGNLAATDLGQTHSATLVSLLSVLRAGRLSDATARQTATDLAARALVDLRAVSDREQALSAEPARAAFALLADQLVPVVSHLDVDIELIAPDEDRQICQDIAHTARIVSRGLVLAALDRTSTTSTTRVRLSWRLDGATLRITARDDAPEVLAAAVEPRLSERIVPLGGRWEVDAVPGWGTTVTAVLPLDITELPELSPLDRLNARELEVLAGISQGLRNRQIADRLQLSEHTVKFHVRNLLEKLEVRSRGEAAALAHALRIDPEPVNKTA